MSIRVLVLIFLPSLRARVICNLGWKQEFRDRYPDILRVFTPKKKKPLICLIWMTIDEEGALVIFVELKVQNSSLEISF